MRLNYAPSAPTCGPKPEEEMLFPPSSTYTPSNLFANHLRSLGSLHTFPSLLTLILIRLRDIQP